MKSSFAKILALTTLICGTAAQKILLANDDGWATANIREEYKELVAAGFEVNTTLDREVSSCSSRFHNF